MYKLQLMTDADNNKDTSYRHNSVKCDK